MSDIDDDGWLESSFGALCLRIVNGGTPDTGNAAYWNGETPWITGADFTVNGVGEFRRFVSDIGILGSATSVVKAGNLIVVTRTGVGKIAIAPCDIAISQDITGVYIDTEKVETFFVYYLLSRELEQIKKLNQGTSINGIIRSDLEKHVVRFPAAKSAQIKIASILSSIDTAIEKTEALIAKYQQIKAGLMHDLFTRGVLPNGQLRPPREQAPDLYQETAIGWIPREWAILTAGEVLTRIDAGWSPECQETPPGIGDWGVLKVSAVTRGVYDPSESKILPQSMVPDPAIEVADGDVILTRANGVAELVGVAVQVRNTPTKLMLSDKLLRLVPQQEKMTRDFLALLMRSSLIKSQIDSVMSGSSGQRNISQSQIKNFFFIKPSLKEQHLIVTYIRAVEVNLERETLAKEKLISQKLGLMQDLLTGKVSVQCREENNLLESVI